MVNDEVYYAAQFANFEDQLIANLSRTDNVVAEVARTLSCYFLRRTWTQVSGLGSKSYEYAKGLNFKDCAVESTTKIEMDSKESKPLSNAGGMGGYEIKQSNDYWQLTYNRTIAHTINETVDDIDITLIFTIHLGDETTDIRARLNWLKNQSSMLLKLLNIVSAFLKISVLVSQRVKYAEQKIAEEQLERSSDQRKAKEALLHDREKQSEKIKRVEHQKQVELVEKTRQFIAVTNLLQHSTPYEPIKKPQELDKLLLDIAKSGEWTTRNKMLIYLVHLFLYKAEFNNKFDAKINQKTMDLFKKSVEKESQDEANVEGAQSNFWLLRLLECLMAGKPVEFNDPQGAFKDRSKLSSYLYLLCYLSNKEAVEEEVEDNWGRLRRNRYRLDEFIGGKLAKQEVG
jgi:hypothetical protein